MNNGEIKVAVVGFGLAGRVFHAPFVSAVPGLKLLEIVQRKGEEAREAYPFAETGVTILRSVDEALASDADLLVIGTPNETHFSLAKQALEAGKHVVVDKPFAATSEEALILTRLAKEKRLVLAPFQNRRWDGDFRTVRKLLKDETLGRLATFESHFDRFRPTPRGNTWKEAGHPANGMLFDLAPHLVDQTMALFGIPQAITASVRIDRDESAIEDAFDIVLHYSSQDGKTLLAWCRASMLACDASPRFLLHGTKGSFKKFGLDPQEPALVGGAKVPRQSSAGDDWLREDKAQWGTLTIAPNPDEPGKLTKTNVETEPGDYRDFYANVRDAIRGTAKLEVTPEDGYRTVRLLELARESSEMRRTLPVEFQ